MADLTRVHNPYDFANPVSKADLFVGRTAELAEIKYYLDYAKSSPRPINIALLGPRASGKTSLLNMCELEGRRREFCTVRVNLDEGDLRAELVFFFKLFDSIVSAVFDLGAFGGKQGRTYDTYLDVVHSYVVPQEKTFCPFLFPLQYARAMASGNANAQLSDHSYMADLEKIRAEVTKPTLILFDEGNVLTKSRIYLEKLRNIFMNTPGFMLVMTGTPDLFPLIDDVFSPIIRQFKKIPVEAFKNLDETKECIRRPLLSAGITPEEVFDFESQASIKEIHDLAAGKPYEIQLICHTLFRNVQENRANRMKLNLAVLEAVRKELEISQDPASRPVLARIRALDKDLTSALALLSTCDGLATFDQIWAIHHTFHANKPWARTALRGKYEYLLQEKILEEREGIIKFAGDDFVKIYTKYWAREQQVPLAFPLMFPDLPLDGFLYFQLLSLLEDSEELHFIGSSRRSFNITEAMERALKGPDLFAQSPRIIEQLYQLLTEHRRQGRIQLLEVGVYFPWATMRSWVYGERLEERRYASLIRRLSALKRRAGRTGGEVTVTTSSVPVPRFEILAKRVEATTNQVIKARLADYHSTTAYQVHLRDPSEALFHADLSYRYKPGPEPMESNNLGYIFSSAGNFDRAKTLLERAVTQYKETHRKALPNYNLGIMEAKLGRFESAAKFIDLAIEQASDQTEADRGCVCLIVPQFVRGKLVFRELRNPDLLLTAQQARSALAVAIERAKRPRRGSKKTH